jgi:hypothetical protein
MKNKIENIQDLRTDLLDAYDSLKKDPRRINQVAELSNTAGKIIGTVKLEMEYAIARREVPNIPFLGDMSMKKALPAETK